MKVKLLLGCVIALPLFAWAASASKDLAQVLAGKPDESRGAQLFQQCVSCHGADGGGEVSGSVPRIAGQHYRVLARQIVDFRHGKRWDFRMEGVATSHKVLPKLSDITDVAWYVSTLDRDGARGVGDGHHVEKGAAIYGAQCASCHGVHGEGNDSKQIPILAGQHAAYLARQIYDAVDGRRPRLENSHGKRFAPLEFEDVRGLTDYLSRLGWRDGVVAPAAEAPRASP
ncbi:MAG TPA: c-type cytochrome [Steroidobacteraceae bacterium]|nr:c-type cytochrome [Steroidobacteraceae bacterium]